MAKTNCNIIKDLLPSYMDAICSQESEQLIKEHLEECENCQKLYKNLQSETYIKNISSAKEVDVLKKIKRNVSQKNAVLYGIIAFLFLLQIYLNLNIHRYSSEVSMYFNYFNYLFPIITSGILFTILPNYAEHKVPAKIKYTILGIEFASMTYIFLLLIYLLDVFTNGKTFLNMHLDEIGPFLNIQIYGLIFLFTVAFVITMVLSIYKKSVCPALHFMPLGGVSLMFEYQRFLGILSIQPQKTNLINPYLAFMGEIILLIGLYLFINHKKSYL